MRIFIAVEISNSDILAKIKDIQGKLQIKAKPVQIHNMHFTLLFLGEVEELMVSKIKDALNAIKFEPFVIKFVGIGAFPKPRFPRVVWVGVDEEGGEKLKELAIKVESILGPLGFKSDKSFKPHVTIFRVKDKIGDISSNLEKFHSAEFGTLRVDEIKLKQSILTPSGPNYSDLQVIKV